MRIPYKNYIGQVYNKLTILDIKHKGKNLYYSCKCECGNLKDIRCDQVLDSSVKSCGCLKHTNKHEDLSGKKYGKLTVIREAGRKSKKILWECKCDCKNIVFITGDNLKSGHTASCGCYQKERTKETLSKHGKTNTRLFTIWQGMKNRCYNKKSNRFTRYGGKGIKVCDEWLNDFQNFYEWAINNGYSETLTIDRVNNNGDYCPENCRWCDYTEQSNNRSTNRFIEYKGERKTIANWSKVTGIPRSTIWNRLKANKTIEEVLQK